jgi:hypothetical protein
MALDAPDSNGANVWVGLMLNGSLANFANDASSAFDVMLNLNPLGRTTCAMYS